ncbi:7 transmembrane sweet-taste receptor of 3 GCPR-domain-containing protein [Paraphysoderma sedebokerense]|nr:7 transmembrane sweet-taste receptor of 3 GCPR-domain-containing protein [Paraphysoderma sedebokerense]
MLIRENLFSVNPPLLVTPNTDYFVLGYRNLLVKTLRIYLIFSNTKGKIMGLSDNQMLKYTASIILLELILLVLSTVIDPPVPVILNLPKLRYWTCASSNPFTHTIFISLLGAYNGSLLIMACYLAIKTRQAQSAYRESKAIGLSIYSISLLLAISFPIIYLTTTLPLFDFHARSLTIIFINIITTASLFYKKVKIILFHPELNNMEALNRKSTNHSLSLHVDPGTGGGGKSGSKNSKKMSDTAMMKQIVLSRRNSSNHDGRGSRRGSEEVQLNIHLHRKPSVGVDRSNTIGPGMLARRSSAQLGNLNHGYDRSRRGSTENGGGPMVKGSSTTVAGSYGVIKEEVEDEKGLVFEPIIELFYISVKSSKKPQWRQYYLYLFPLTEHLMMTKDPNPTTAPMIHLSLCRVRNISHIWKQCIELHTPSGKVYLIRTKHELVFTKWWTLLQRVVGTCETGKNSLKYQPQIILRVLTFCFLISIVILDAKAPNKSEQQPQNRFTPFLQLPLTRKPSILGTPGEGKLDKLNSFLPKMGKPGGVKATGIMS